MLFRRAALVLVLACTVAVGQPAPARRVPNPEQQAARYLDSIRGNTALLAAFLRAMPKGADLHNHLSGAVYAESYIQWAAADGLCVERRTLTLVQPPCDDSAGKPPATRALADAVLYREMVDAFSMRHHSDALKSGHDQFFDAFGKFGAVSRNHVGQMLAEVVGRAASQNLQYIELILNLERGQATALGARLGWDPDFDSFRKKVDGLGAAEIVATARRFLDAAEAEMRAAHACRNGIPMVQMPSQNQWRACTIEVRYIQEVYRGLPKEQMFAQMQVAFMLADADPRVVSVNPVMPEDAYVPMTDFALHMRMFDYFHNLYPKVKLTLHAGELAPRLVPPEGLRHHIRDSILLGHASRIGHGTDVMHEDQPFELLKLMRERNIMVEINLTSNDVILGVAGARHPLPVYMKFGVPVALSTDDEGVARSDITHEYLRAVQDYRLSYADLKKLARTGIEHGFADEETRTRLKKRFDQAFADFERECCTHTP